MFSEAIGALQAMEHKTGVAYFMNLLGLARLAVNDQEGAAGAYRQSLRFCAEVGYKWGLSQAFIGVAALIASRGDQARAVRLLEASTVLLAAIEYLLPVAEQAFLDHLVQELRSSMDLQGFDAAWAEGQAMTLEQAIADSEELLEPTPAPPSTDAHAWG